MPQQQCSTAQQAHLVHKLRTEIAPAGATATMLRSSRPVAPRCSPDLTASLNAFTCAGGREEGDGGREGCRGVAVTRSALKARDGPRAAAIKVRGSDGSAPRPRAAVHAGVWAWAWARCAPTLTACGASHHPFGAASAAAARPAPANRSPRWPPRLTASGVDCALPVLVRRSESHHLRQQRACAVHRYAVL